MLEPAGIRLLQHAGAAVKHLQPSVHPRAGREDPRRAAASDDLRRSQTISDDLRIQTRTNIKKEQEGTGWDRSWQVCIPCKRVTYQKHNGFKHIQNNIVSLYTMQCNATWYYTVYTYAQFTKYITLLYNPCIVPISGWDHFFLSRNRLNKMSGPRFVGGWSFLDWSWNSVKVLAIWEMWCWIWFQGSWTIPICTLCNAYTEDYLHVASVSEDYVYVASVSEAFCSDMACALIFVVCIFSFGIPRVHTHIEIQICRYNMVEYLCI